MVDTTENNLEILVVQVGERLLGLDAASVIRLQSWTDPTPLPGVPDYVSGLISGADRIMPVVDLGALLQTGNSEVQAGELVLVDTGGAPCALRVDSAQRRVTLEASALHRFHAEEAETDPTESGDESEGWHLVVAEFEHEGRPVLLLDLNEIRQAIMPRDMEFSGEAFLGAPEPEEEQDHTEESTDYLLFSVGGESYALPLVQVLELLDVAECAPLPRAPSTVLGLARVREHGLLLLDACRLLGLRARVDQPEKWPVLVLRVEGRDYGLVVDSVDGIRNYPDSARRPVAETESALDFILVPDDQQLVSVLSPRGVLPERQRERLAPYMPEYGVEDEEEVVATETFLQVRIGGELHGIPLQAVSGVEDWRDPEPVQDERNPDLRGVLDLRGEVLPVLNSDHLFSLSHPTANQHLVILEMNAGRRALPVDDALQLVEIPENAISELRNTSTPCVTRLANHEDQLISLVNVQHLHREEAVS